MKLKHVGEYIINPDNIAYMSIWTDKDGMSRGTSIHFNAYAAAATGADWAFEPLCIQIAGKTPVEIMDFINDEPAF
jgi:hypothetical protein